MGLRLIGTLGGVNLARLVDDQMASRFDAPLTTEAEAPAGGGGETPNEDTSTAGDPPPEPAATGGPDSEDDDDDLVDDPDLRDDDQPIDRDRFKRVTGKLTKLNRRDRRARPVMARLKDLERQGLSLDDLIVKARGYDSLDQNIKSNPRLRALIHGEPEPERRPAVDEEPDFDESALPFDPDESPTNRYFANLARANHDQQRVNRQLLARLDRFEGNDVARTEAAIKSDWKRTIDTAASYIKDTGVQTLFRDAMTAAFHHGGRTGRLQARAIASHYLKELKVNPQQAAAATAAVSTAPRAAGAAAQQRIAENNRNLPRNVAPNGNPTPARAPRENLDDVRRRLTGSRR